MGMDLEIEEVICGEPLPLLSLNHVSLLVRSVWLSVRFYEDVLGFSLVKRPSSFNFHGAWLYNYGIGIHLLENEFMDEYEDTNYNDPRPINPKDNHISFQCTDVGIVKKRLEELAMRYVTAVVEDEGKQVDQVFFHDPDGYMIEICNCENIPTIPISSSCPFRPKKYKSTNGSFRKRMETSTASQSNCGLMVETAMQNLSMDIMNFTF